MQRPGRSLPQLSWPERFRNDKIKVGDCWLNGLQAESDRVKQELERRLALLIPFSPSPLCRVGLAVVQRWGPTWKGNSTSHVGAELNSNERRSWPSRKLPVDEEAQTCPCPRHVCPLPTAHTAAWSPHETSKFPNGLQDPCDLGPACFPASF